MTKRSKSDDEESHSSEEKVDEGTPPPPKKQKKTAEMEPTKTEKKAPKSKSATKEPSPSGSGGKKGNLAKNVFTNSSGEKYVDLGKKKHVTVRTFKGSILVDIREFYGKDNDDLQPGKKGISLTPEQWAELKANAKTINGLVKKLQVP